MLTWSPKPKTHPKWYFSKRVSANAGISSLKKTMFLECGLIDSSQNLSNPMFGTKTWIFFVHKGFDFGPITKNWNRWFLSTQLDTYPTLVNGSKHYKTILVHPTHHLGDPNKTNKINQVPSLIHRLVYISKKVVCCLCLPRQGYCV
jgi:hypothetical protein